MPTALALASLGLLWSASVRGQTPQPQAPPPQPPPAAAPADQGSLLLSPEQLDELLAPIALYPDALVAMILPAATFPSDLVLASRYIGSNGDPSQLGNQPWDDSVKSLARYPDVLKWMDQNLEWTSAVGDAFVAQPADVMNSIQRLRTAAAAAGNLVDTPQQRVVHERTCIRIVPAEPDFIYVPQYDPGVVYERPYAPDFGPPLAFGVGFAVGSWLNYDCDWNSRAVYVGKWRPGWKDRWDDGDGRRDWGPDRGPNNNIINVVNISSDGARPWRPSENSQRRQRERTRDPRNAARLSAANVSQGDPQAIARSAEAAGIGAVQRGNVPRPSRFAAVSAGNGNGRDGRNGRAARGANEAQQLLPAANPEAAANARNGRDGRNGQVARGANEGQQLLPAPNPEAAAARGGGRKGKVPNPSAAPGIQASEGLPPAPSTKNQGNGARAKGGRDNRDSQPGRAGDIAPNAASVTAPPGKKNDSGPSPVVDNASGTEKARKGGENLKTSGGGHPSGQGERRNEQAPAPSAVASSASPGGNESSHGKAGNQPKRDGGPKAQPDRQQANSSGQKAPHHPQNAASQPGNPQGQGGGKQKHGEPSAGGNAKRSTPAAAAPRHEQPRPAAAPARPAPAQQANPAHGKGKGGGGKKEGEKKDKGGN